MTLTPVRPPLPAGRKNGRLAWIDNLPVVILYDADESRALEWTTSSAATWPTLTGATVAFISRHTTQTSRTLSAAGSVVVATGASKQVRVELAPADTNSRPSGGYTYQLIATLTNNHVVTLAAGDLTLTERLRA